MKDMIEQLKLSCVWFVKLFQVHDKLEARDRVKTSIFVPYQTTTQLFVPRTDCLKYRNSILSPKIRIKEKIIQCHKNLSCVVLPCIVMFFLVLFYTQYLLFCKPNASVNGFVNTKFYPLILFDPKANICSLKTIIYRIW